MMGLFSYRAVNLPSTRVPTNPQDWPAGARRRTHFGQEVLWHEYHHDDDDDDDEVGRDGSSHPPPDHTPTPNRRRGRHLPAHILEPYRQQGDARFDTILELYAQEGRPLLAGDDLLARVPTTTSGNHNVSNHPPTDSSPADSALRQTLEYYRRIPSWVDPSQLSRGQSVFLAYLPAMGLSLYYRSLVPGFSIPKIAAVLQATAYLAPPAPRRAVRERLEDTGALLGACLQSPNVAEILPGGEGWKAALRVRLLHAKVRRRLLASRKATKHRRPWNKEELGVPINQEDMAATLLAFSTNALWGCEMILGRPLPRQDRLDYLALWRYLGWLLGVDVQDDSLDRDAAIRNNLTADGNNPYQQPRLRPLDPCGPGWYRLSPSPEEHSYAIFQSIIFHTLHPDQSSVRIAHHLLKQGRRQDGDDDGEMNKGNSKQQMIESDLNWFYFRSFQCRRFVGDDLADALQLPLRPTWFGTFKLWCISQLYLGIVTCYTIAGLPWSPIRNRLIRFHRTHMATFMERWNESHVERMRKQLVASSDLSISKGSSSVCPFAMVTHEDSSPNFAQ